MRLGRHHMANTRREIGEGKRWKCVCVREIALIREGKFRVGESISYRLMLMLFSGLFWLCWLVRMNARPQMRWGLAVVPDQFCGGITHPKLDCFRLLTGSGLITALGLQWATLVCFQGPPPLSFVSLAAPNSSLSRLHRPVDSRAGLHLTEKIRGRIWR